MVYKPIDHKMTSKNFKTHVEPRDLGEWFHCQVLSILWRRFTSWIGFFAVEKVRVTSDVIFIVCTLIDSRYEYSYCKEVNSKCCSCNMNPPTHMSGPLLDENSQWNIKIVFFPVKLLLGFSRNSL